MACLGAHGSWRHRAGAALLAAALLILGQAGLAAQELLSGETPLADSIVLGLGWGAALPLAAGFPPGLGVEAIHPGPTVEDLVRQITVHRTVANRLAIDIDHDSARLGEGELFGGSNLYSLRWQGWEGEPLREISLGNLVRSMPGSRYLPLDAGGPESFALHAEAQVGPFTLDGLARYGGSLEGRRRFRGSRLAVEVDLKEVDYARGQFFLLPDAGVDEAGLRVARSSPTGPITIDGRRFALISRGADWRLDNSARRLTLARPLAQSEELAVAYTKAGVSVGEAGLGSQAIIDQTGSRSDFLRSDPRFSAYFGTDGSSWWLFLRRQALNGYWELRNTFALEGLEDGGVPEALSVEVLRTATLAPNPAYDQLADRFRVSVADGTLSFEFSDSVAVYPRPFPGEEPFGAMPRSPLNNPFDPDNPIYGGPSYAPPEASVTTLRVRYLLSMDTWRLEPNLVPDSVRVTVDGAALSPPAYTVDPIGGTISFAAGVIGPQSDVEVVYRRAPTAGTGREMLAAFGAGVGDELRGARNLITLQLPIALSPAPRLGEVEPARLSDSLDAVASFGAAAGQTGPTATIRTSGAIGLSVADPAGLAILADMEDDRRIALSMAEEGWTIAARSSVLPALAVPVALGDRGELRYENLWERQPLGGEVLRDITWDNAANPQFTYAQKAGPYASSDAPPGGTGPSLVLDVAFAQGAADAWAAASTVLSGVDAGGAERVQVWLRGVDVTGAPGATLQVYAEALSRMSEDIDADGVLDGEASAAQPGYTITPSGGAVTVLGADRRGGPNGKRDSEDRNSNGVLDLAPETGVVLASASGPQYLATIPAGTSDWTEVVLDVADLVKANPTVFRDLRGIRLTVTPSSTGVDVSGKVLVGGMWFSGSGMSATSAALSIREVRPAEDAGLAAHPFASAWPALYERLHGSAAWREDHGLADKSLACEVISDMAAGEAVGAERRMAPPTDLSPWRLLTMYVLFLPGEMPPPEAAVTVALTSGSDTLAADASVSYFAEGWNEVTLRLEAPWAVTVNGAEAGALAGATGVVRRVASVTFGLRAGASGISSGQRFITDEWHVAEARTAVETAGLAEVEAGWRGAALSIGGFPLLSDAVVTASVEHRDGSFLGPFDRRENRWQAGLDAILARLLAASFEAGGSVGRPSTVESGIVPELLKGTTKRWSMGIVLDTGSERLPVLEHRWERLVSAERVPTVAPVGLEVSAYGSDRESLAVSERLGQDKEGLSQSLSFTRTWIRDTRELRAATDGTLVESTAEDGLREAGRAGLAWRWNGREVKLVMSRDRLFAAPSGPAPRDGPLSYADRFATLFADPAVALPGASERSLADAMSFLLQLPRTRYLGASVAWEASYGELNLDPLTGSRDVSTRSTFTLSAPSSPDGSGRIVLTPAAAVSFTGSYRAAAPSLDEATLLFAPYPTVLAVPFAYLWPEGWGRSQEHAAVDAFAEAAGLEHASNLVATSFELTARVSSATWPGPDRATLRLRGDTGRDGDARSQKRTASLSLGGDGAIGRGEAGIDAEASLVADYGAKVRALSLSARSSLLVPGVGRGEMEVDGSASWTRDRQSLDDPSMSLFPGIADDPSIVIATRPDKDTLRAGITAVLRQLVQDTTNTERLAVESIMTWTASSASTSSVPIRATFEHSSEIAVSDSLSLTLTGRAAAGVERRAGSGDEVLLPAVGFELGLTGRLSF